MGFVLLLETGLPVDFYLGVERFFALWQVQ